MKKILFICLSLALLMTSCSSKWSMESIDGYPDGIYTEITTNKGVILASLSFKQVPVTVGNFIALAEGHMENSYKGPGEPFYDGLTFHRVVPNFMIQGGDPLANGMGSAGYSFRDEFFPGLFHNKPGTLSMANSGPSTNGSQFFITHTVTPWLDNKHSVFGYVVKGMEVVNAIAQGDVIQKVKIYRNGDEAKAFKPLEAFEAR